MIQHLALLTICITSSILGVELADYPKWHFHIHPKSTDQTLKTLYVDVQNDDLRITLSLHRSTNDNFAQFMTIWEDRATAHSTTLEDLLKLDPPPLDPPFAQSLARHIINHIIPHLPDTHLQVSKNGCIVAPEDKATYTKMVRALAIQPRRIRNQRSSEKIFTTGASAFSEIN